jgi:hypothetical protein
MSLENMDFIGLKGIPVRTKRAAMLLNVVCTKEGQGPVTVRVRNLSETGIGGVVMGNADFVVDEVVALTFKNFSAIAARVVWIEGDKIGLAFDQPIQIERIKSAREWNGPSFDISRKHMVADKCWRPGWRE